VDRDYGIVENIHHDIGTHIIHHLFTKIPHYNLRSATQSIKPVIGKFYKKSTDTTFEAMARVWKNCRFVPNEGDVVFYQSNNLKQM